MADDYHPGLLRLRPSPSSARIRLAALPATVIVDVDALCDSVSIIISVDGVDRKDMQRIVHDHGR